MSNRKRRNSLKDAKGFDPQESMQAALEILTEAGVPFALAGRLAVWTYVPPHRQQYTKDVDFAVPYGYSEQAARVAEEMGYTVTKLSLGYGVRKGKVHVDFIDHHPYLTELYHAAVVAAREEAEAGAGPEEGEPPVVPISFLIAMKLAAGRQKDDLDVGALLKELDEHEYREVRGLVMERLGYPSATRLDMIARGIGHAGPGMEVDS